ncbi:MAG: ROK family protein [Caldilineaceae bacterium]
MAFAIGVDIGGSAIKFAVVDQAGRIVWPPGLPNHSGKAARVGYRVVTPGVARLIWQATGEEEVLTYEVPSGDSPSASLVDDAWVVPAAVARAALTKSLQRIAGSFTMPVAAAGIGATGLIGPDGIVREGYAFSGYCGTNWAAAAAAAGFRGPIQVLNDARAAAWAEYVRAGRGRRAFLHVTVGTRVGCAMVENGQLLEGADACAGEFSYQQMIGPGTGGYRAGARLIDGLLDDPTAFGAALTDVIHLINPNRIALCGFASDFVTAVQAHVDRYVFKTHRRTLETAQGDGSGSLLYVMRHGDNVESAVLSDGQTGNTGVAPDFLSRMIVCAPLPLDRPGELYYGEIAGSFGIEADYAARMNRSAGFDEIAAAAAAGDVPATACLERAAMITAAGIVNACRMTGAQLVTVGGAVPLLYAPYMKIVSEYATAQFGAGSAAPTIQPSTAGNDAGVIGAALYALRTATSPAP